MKEHDVWVKHLDLIDERRALADRIRQLERETNPTPLPSNHELDVMDWVNSDAYDNE